MRDPFQTNRRRRHGLRLIEVDAWIDSSLFRIGRGIAASGEAVSAFMRRFRVTGYKRALVEVAGDGATVRLTAGDEALLTKYSNVAE